MNLNFAIVSAARYLKLFHNSNKFYRILNRKLLLQIHWRPEGLINCFAKNNEVDIRIMAYELNFANFSLAWYIKC